MECFVNSTSRKKKISDSLSIYTVYTCVSICAYVYIYVPRGMEKTCALTSNENEQKHYNIISVFETPQLLLFIEINLKTLKIK